MPAQPAATGVAELGRQADTQILISAEDAAGRATRAVVGNYTTERALELLLENTGLRVERSGAGTFIVVRSLQGAAAAQAGVHERGVPEILVVGQREWSLNTGIERTRDDAQPFVVLSREDIKRSGATNIEQFLRDQLNFNASEATAEQSTIGTAANVRQQGVTSVDLRGLGSRETLILVDGRRQPGLSQGTGEFFQSQITNIPLASIERIEVLASSAAGIYGMGATGGVINIILRRDYSGREVSLNYADTTDFHAADKRIDLLVGQALEGGRTNVSLTATYRQANPLLRKHRAGFLEDNLRYILRNDPEFFSFFPPAGATPNIRSSNGQPLRLDPQFGGTLLSSNRLFIPEGFRGVAIDGIQPLLANLGQYNIEIPDTADNGRRPLLNGISQMGGTLALRREMTSWLRFYSEAAYSVYKNKDYISLAAQTFFIPGNAPNNPFQNQIAVRAPISGAERIRRSKNTELRLVAGATAELPYDWQVGLDVSYNRARHYTARFFEDLRDESVASFENGTFNLLQDTSLVSFPLTFFEFLTPDLPFESSVNTAALKVAGPVPVQLPGGRPTLALGVEQTIDKAADAFSVNGTLEGGSEIRITPARRQRVNSAYGEIRLPLVGETNDIPLVQALEVVLAGRYEAYKGRGSRNNVQCFFTQEPISDVPANLLDLCDTSALDLPSITAENSRFEPSLSVKWTVSPDIAFRGSYATGYLPPRLSELVSRTETTFVIGMDPQRGNERVGNAVNLGGGLFVGFLPGSLSGGNPDVKPERSKTISLGMILTPRFLPGLRFSADYTKIRKRDNYLDPRFFLLNFGPGAQQSFETYLKLFPERVTRGAPSDGFAVGPITQIDTRIVNIAGTNTEAIDLALDYGQALWGGRINFAASATRNLEASSQLFPGDSVIDVVGARPVSVSGVPAGPFGNVSLKWRGVGTLNWSNDRFNVGARLRYFGPFDLNYEGIYDPRNDAVSIDQQAYVDLFASYELLRNVTLRGGINNVFGSRPPFINARYSEYGDPRMSNFYLNLTTRF